MYNMPKTSALCTTRRIVKQVEEKYELICLLDAFLFQNLFLIHDFVLLFSISILYLQHFKFT